ncbi:hypothetical protein F5X99DRAFT_406011 [Biscogniauxia marginata]|nr:hypothetical protein F5X99DRAFT_406011 [Biscogniauxia marginata]
MADAPPPSPAKRVLPFKRTVKRKTPIKSPENDDGLSLFSRSKEFFPSVLEDQQRRALEKAAKAEQEEKERLAREREDEEESALREQFLREAESAKKRRRVSAVRDEDEDEEDSGQDGEDDDVFSDKPRKPRKSSIIPPQTPTSKRARSILSSSKGGSRAPHSRSHKSETPAFNLDDDGDEIVEYAKPSTRSTTSAVQSRKKPDKASSALLKDGASDSDSDLEMYDGNPDGQHQEESKDDDDDSDATRYVKMAMERIERAKQERLAREAAAAAGGASAVNDGNALVEMLVGSCLDGIKPISFKVRTRQPLKVMFDTWLEQQDKRKILPRALLQDMFFTWKGNRVYPHTTLETLNIRPDAAGQLYPAWRSGQDGFHNRNKVYFEAWTKELYAECQREKERERKHELGEWDDDDDAAGDAEQGQAAGASDPDGEKRVRVIFRAKDLPPRNATLRSNTTVAMMIKVVRKLAKVPADKTVELHFDGEILEEDMTVEEADIGDMESVEVHIR